MKQRDDPNQPVETEEKNSKNTTETRTFSLPRFMENTRS
jgi:hypothetical protein